VLYERYANQIFRYCLHQLGSREEAEDAVQSTFLNAFRGLRRGVVPELESAWLFKIAHNVCLSRRRSSWRRGRVESPADFQLVEELTPAPSRRGDELIGLQDVLGQMPESQRRAILLREWQGLSYREIADELKLTQSAVETLIFRARRSLAQGLEEPPERLRKRVRRGADLGNVFAALKSLLLGGSAAAKVVAAVAVVGAGTVAATAPLQHRPHVVAPLVVPKAAVPAAPHTASQLASSSSSPPSSTASASAPAPSSSSASSPPAPAHLARPARHHHARTGGGRGRWAASAEAVAGGRADRSGGASAGWAPAGSPPPAREHASSPGGPATVQHDASGRDGTRWQATAPASAVRGQDRSIAAGRVKSHEAPSASAPPSSAQPRQSYGREHVRSTSSRHAWTQSGPPAPAKPAERVPSWDRGHGSGRSRHPAGQHGYAPAPDTGPSGRTRQAPPADAGSGQASTSQRHDGSSSWGSSSSGSSSSGSSSWGSSKTDQGSAPSSSSSQSSSGWSSGGDGSSGSYGGNN
jgi:RNA polymerase sigma factor (sigma-70 family)